MGAFAISIPRTQVNGQTAAFLDGPAGDQAPSQVIAAIQNYLMKSNANTGGVFTTSQSSDEMIANTRAMMADAGLVWPWLTAEGLL